MIRAADVIDTYREGTWLRRWSLVDGHARCLVDACAVAACDPAVLDAQRTANAEVRARLAAVENYEAALSLAAQEEPPPTIGGEDGPVPNPVWQAWTMAKASVADADADTIALHGARRDAAS